MTVHLTLDDEARDGLALHALDALEPADVAALEAHLAACAACRLELESLRATVAELGALAPALAPPADLRRRLLARLQAERSSERRAAPVQVWRDWDDGVPPADLIRRAGDGAWEPTGTSGVLVRRLFVDRAGDRVTMLVRMAPGSAFSAHRHRGPEECYVLAGDIRVGGDIVLRSGDYQRVERDSVHPVQSTEGGCLLFITSSLHDELLGPGGADASAPDDRAR